MGGYGFGFGPVMGEGRGGEREDWIGIWRICYGRTDLGIRTPLLHNISSVPKGWVPSMYCNGLPFARSWHIRWRCRRHDVLVGPVDVDVTVGFATACSRSQRSSLRAEGRSRHERRRRGRRGCSARARRMREVGRRGIHGPELIGSGLSIYHQTKSILILYLKKKSIER